MCREYNGHANKPTWDIVMYYDSTERLQAFAIEFMSSVDENAMREVYRGDLTSLAWSDFDDGMKASLLRQQRADAFQEYVESLVVPDASEPWGGLLRWALAIVDWRGVVDFFMAEDD